MYSHCEQIGLDTWAIPRKRNIRNIKMQKYGKMGNVWNEWNVLQMK